MKRIPSFKDRLGHNINEGDIVLYPRMVCQFPEITLARVLSINESTDYRGTRVKSVRLRIIEKPWWKFDSMNNGSVREIYTYVATVTSSIRNLVYVNVNSISDIDYDLLVHQMTIKVKKVNGKIYIEDYDVAAPIEQIERILHHYY